MRILRVTIGIWLIGMMTAVSMGGQATVDDPQAVVLAAFERLETYTFTSQLTSHSIYTNEAGESTEVMSLSTLDGNILANGDRQTTLKQFSGETIVDAFGSRALIVEQIQLENEVYVSVGNLEYLEIIEPGWWRYDDLMTQVESMTTQVLLDDLLKRAVPSEYLIQPEYIQTVSEQPNETVDGVVMRVFEVEMDALALNLATMEGTEEEKEAALNENPAFIEAIELSTVYRLWIGAENGFLYRGMLTSRSFIPYLTAGGDNPSLDFDIEINVAGEFEITSYAAPPEISIPAAVNELP